MARWTMGLLVLTLVGCSAAEVHAGRGASSGASSNSTGTTGSSTGSGSSSGTGSSASSSSSGSSSSSSSGGSGGFAPGVHPPWPQVPAGAAASLDATELVVITFDSDAAGTDGGYPYQDTVEAFGAWMLEDGWLTSVAGEYGVGAGAARTPVRLAEAAPAAISDAEVQQFLEAKLNSGELPLPDANLIYMVFYPQGTVVTLENGAVGCTDFAGYHFDAQVTVGGQGYLIGYAVVPDCDAPGAGLTELQQIEIAASHELVEEATDPEPDLEPSYILPDGDPWSATGGELADLCQSNYQRASGTPYLFQRSWSNTLALGDGSPCAPAPATPSKPFLGVAPADPEEVHGNAGETVHVPLVGWSTAPHAPWPILARTIVGNFDPQPSASPATIGNGGTATLNLHLPANATSGESAVVWVFTQQGLGNDSQWWPLVVRVN